MTNSLANLAVFAPVDQHSPVCDWAPSNADPPGIPRIATVAEAQDEFVIARSPRAIAATHHSVNVVKTDQADRTRGLRPSEETRWISHLLC